MAHDDYFVITYRLLKYLYSCLKSGAAVDLGLLTAEYFNIPGSYWDYIVLNLHKDGFVDGVTVTRIGGKPNAPVIRPHFQITPKGIQHLEENSAFEKVRGYLRDLSGLLP